MPLLIGHGARQGKAMALYYINGIISHPPPQSESARFPKWNPLHLDPQKLGMGLSLNGRGFFLSLDLGGDVSMEDRDNPPTQSRSDGPTALKR